MGPEAKLEARLVEKCSKIGALCWKFTSPSRRGVPDRIIMYKGKVYFVELKSETGQLTELQRQVHIAMYQAGIVVHVLNFKEAIDNFVEEIKNA